MAEQSGLGNFMADTLHNTIAERDRLKATVAELLQAVRLYFYLDTDRRAGCTLEDSDWGECYDAARAAIERAKPHGS